MLLIGEGLEPLSISWASKASKGRKKQTLPRHLYSNSSEQAKWGILFSEGFLRKGSKVKLSHARGKVKTEDLEPQVSWDDSYLWGHCSTSHPGCAQPLSQVQLFPTLWTVAHHTPLSMKFSRQEYWSEKPFPSPTDLPNPGIERHVSSLQADSLPLSHLGSPHFIPQVDLFNTLFSIHKIVFSVIITFLDSFFSFGGFVMMFGKTNTVFQV